MNGREEISHAGRWARRLGILLAATYGLYLVAGNLLLNTSIGHSLANRQPQKFLASWGTAWTLYPGHVSARDLRIAGHVRRTVWSVQADAVAGRVALVPLLARQLRVPEVLASGVTGGATIIDVVREPPAPRPGGWTLRFDAIAAEGVRHAYFNDFVLVTDGHGVSGFAKTLRGGAMEVLPSRITLDDGVLWRDGARLAWKSRIEGTFAIARHLRSEAPGVRKLEMTDATIDIEATTAGAMVEFRSGQKPMVRVTDGPGSLQAKLAWQRGSLAPGGHARSTWPVHDNLEGKLESTAARVELTVADDEMRFSGGLAPVHDASFSVDADLRVQGRTIPLQALSSLTRRTSGHVASRWHFDTLAWLNDLLPGSKLLKLDGAGTLHADLKFHDGEIEAGSFIEAPAVAATVRALGNDFKGNAHARLTVEVAAAGRLEPHLEAVMEQFSVAPADAADQPYVHGTDLRIDAVSDAGERHLDELDDRIRARLRFSDAHVPDLRVYNRYLPRTSLQLEGGEGRLSGDLHFDRQGDLGRGQLRMTGSGIRLRVADLDLAGDIGIESRLQRADLEAHSFNADGSRLELKGVRVTSGEELLASDWWGRIDLERAQLDWDRPMTLDGRMRLHMKDVGMLLALYSHRKTLPRWVARLVDQGEASAEGRVHWHDDTLLLEPLTAANERFDLAARLRLHEKKPAGDFYARWGALSIGMELADGDKHLHLVGARHWFDNRPSLSSR
jgi:hypothetical protein